MFSTSCTVQFVHHILTAWEPLKTAAVRARGVPNLGAGTSQHVNGQRSIVIYSGGWNRLVDCNIAKFSIIGEEKAKRLRYVNFSWLFVSYFVARPARKNFAKIFEIPTCVLVGVC